MAHKVFISHSSKDKSIADGVCNFLESADMECWIAPRDIRSGERWPEAIDKAIGESRVMVLIFSRHANESKDVANELILAMNSDVVVIPFRIDDSEQSGVIDYYLAGAQWLDADNPPTLEQITRLAATTNLYLSGEKVSPYLRGDEDEADEAQTDDGEKPLTDKEKEELRYKKWSTRFVVIALLLAAGLFFADMPETTKEHIDSMFPGIFEMFQLNGDEEEEKEEPWGDGLRGNSVGNIVNSGLLAEQDDWLYFANRHSENRIYKTHIDENEPVRVNNHASNSINVAGNWIYYANEDHHYSIYKVQTDGRGLARICDDHAEYINVVDGWIYYVNLTREGRIYKIRTDGSEKTRLTFDRAEYLNVKEDWIYFANHGHHGNIYRVNTEGGEKTIINDEHSRFINVVGDWIYYANGWENDHIYKIRTDGSERTLVSSNQARYLNVKNDWIYYMNFDDGGRLYKVRTDGSEKTRLNYNHTGFIHATEGWLYYLDRDHGDELHRIRPDGSEEQRFYFY